MQSLVLDGVHAALLPKPGDLRASAADVEAERDRVPLELFRAMTRRVPAYADFLHARGIDPAGVRTAADVRALPALTKNEYLRKYPLADLCWDGKLDDKNLIYTSTSGSTGEPFYFPRDLSMDYRSSLLFELYLRGMNGGREVPTLAIIGFGLGAWIGGFITYNSFRMVGERGYPLSVITPGTNKEELFKAMLRLAPMYEQVIVCGYPPFLKDVLDGAVERGFDTSRGNVKLLCAAEGFDESFRDYVVAKAGVVDVLHGTANIYGTADIGTMAIETPLSIAMRRLAVADPRIHTALFGDTSGRLPTLAQFHPLITDFQEENGELLVSGDSALPLLRYSLGDRGGVRSYEEALGAVASVDAAAAAGLRAVDGAAELPFVFVYERVDFSVKLYGAIIYPEHARAALLTRGLDSHVTGKCVLDVRRDASQDEFLEVHVELRAGTSETDALRDRVAEAVYETMREKNAEYRLMSDASHDCLVPRVVLWPYEHPEHFSPRGKQKWVKKP